MGTEMDWTSLSLEFAMTHPLLVIVNIVVIALVPLNEVVLPHFYGKLVRDFQSRRSITRVLVTVVSLMIGIRLVANVLEPFDARFTGDLHTFVRDHCLKRLIHASDDDLVEMRGGDVIARFTKLPVCMENIVNIWRTAILPTIVGFVFCIAYLATIDPMLSILVGGIASVYMGIIVLVPSSCVSQSLSRDAAYNDIIEEIDDVLVNAVSVIGQSQQVEERRRIMEHGDRYSERYVETVECYMPTYGIIATITLAFLVALLFRTRTLMFRRAIDSATLVAITFVIMYSINALSRSTSVVRPLTFQYGILEGSSSIFERPQSQLLSDAGEQEREHEQQSDASRARGIVLEDVCFAYPSTPDRLILSGVSAVIPDGSTTILWGGVGSGKSTMVKLLMRYAIPTRGELYMWGEPYSRVGSRKVRSQIAYVPQHSVLFNRSILENIAYGTTDASMEDILSVVTRLGLLDDQAFGSLPDGLLTIAGKEGSKLSGGQRQLVLIARAILSSKRVIVLDEPSASLDDASRELVMGCLRRVRVESNATIVIVTHDPKLLAIADRILTIDHGHVSLRAPGEDEKSDKF